MIIKKRTKPLALQMLDALISRMQPYHPRLQEMRRDAAIRNKGYYGELQVDYHLEKLAQQATMLQDVSLSIHGRNVQIDTVIITNHAIYCIESKNYDGTITFNTILRQFTRNNGENEAGFRYPISQVKNQKIQLMTWLHEQGLRNIPVYYFIAISEPSTIIKAKGDEHAIAKVVAHAEHIPAMILERDQTLKREGRKTLRRHKIGKIILRACQTYSIDVMRKYNIEKKDILPGIHCPSCQKLWMERKWGKWLCNRCGKASKQAHLQALNDYFILINPSITNKNAMHFLKVSSRHIVSRLLKNSHLVYRPKSRTWLKKLKMDTNTLM